MRKERKREGKRKEEVRQRETQPGEDGEPNWHADPEVKQQNQSSPRRHTGLHRSDHLLRDVIGTNHMKFLL